MTWQIGNYQKINCVIFNTIQGVFALSSYLDGLQPVFIYHQTSLKSRFQVLPWKWTFIAALLRIRDSVWAFPVADWERGKNEAMKLNIFGDAPQTQSVSNRRIILIE